MTLLYGIKATSFFLPTFPPPPLSCRRRRALRRRDHRHGRRPVVRHHDLLRLEKHRLHRALVRSALHCEPGSEALGGRWRIAACAQQRSPFRILMVRSIGLFHFSTAAAAALQAVLRHLEALGAGPGRSGGSGSGGVVREPRERLGGASPSPVANGHARGRRLSKSKAGRRAGGRFSPAGAGAEGPDVLLHLGQCAGEPRRVEDHGVSSRVQLHAFGSQAG